jgi:hypothetical protein
MLIDHPSGFGKQFIADSAEPQELSRQEISDIALQVEELLNQSDAQVALLIADNFPNTKVMVRGTGEGIEFTFFEDEKLLLTIDEIGWKIVGEKLEWKWSGIIEGTPRSVAESILRNFAKRGFLVYHPPRGSQDRKNRKIMNAEN